MENMQLKTVSREEIGRKVQTNVNRLFRKFKYVMQEKEMELLVHKDFEQEAKQTLNQEINKYPSDYMISFIAMNSGNAIKIKLVKERKKDNGQVR